MKSRAATQPFIEFTCTRYGDEPEDIYHEAWSFMIWGHDGIVAYDNVSYVRHNATDAEMLSFIAEQAERHLLHDGGPFFVLRDYLSTGAYRSEIDAVLRKPGQSPMWRRAENIITESLGLRRAYIRWRRGLAR